MAFKRKYSRKSYGKSRRGKSSRMYRRKTFKARVNQVLMKKTETKWFEIGVENQQLYHNLGWGTTLLIPTTPSAVPLWFNPWNNISQGPARYQRIGDKIMPRGMSLKIYLANKYDRPHTQIRLIVAILPKINFQTSAISTTNFNPFQNVDQGALGNNMLPHADGDRGVKFLYDKIHKLDNMGSFTSAPGGGYAKECTKYIKLWIKRKRAGPIVFDQTGAGIVNRPLAIYAIPYEQYSALTTDNVSSLAGTLRLYYKDS